MSALKDGQPQGPQPRHGSHAHEHVSNSVSVSVSSSSSSSQDDDGDGTDVHDGPTASRASPSPGVSPTRHASTADTTTPTASPTHGARVQSPDRLPPLELATSPIAPPTASLTPSPHASKARLRQHGRLSLSQCRGGLDDEDDGDDGDDGEADGTTTATTTVMTTAPGRTRVGDGNGDGHALGVISGTSGHAANTGRGSGSHSSSLSLDLTNIMPSPLAHSPVPSDDAGGDPPDAACPFPSPRFLSSGVLAPQSSPAPSRPHHAPPPHTPPDMSEMRALPGSPFGVPGSPSPVPQVALHSPLPPLRRSSPCVSPRTPDRSMSDVTLPSASLLDPDVDDDGFARPHTPPTHKPQPPSSVQALRSHAHHHHGSHMVHSPRSGTDSTTTVMSPRKVKETSCHKLSSLLADLNPNAEPGSVEDRVRDLGMQFKRIGADSLKVAHSQEVVELIAATKALLDTTSGKERFYFGHDEDFQSVHSSKGAPPSIRRAQRSESGPSLLTQSLDSLKWKELTDMIEAEEEEEGMVRCRVCEDFVHSSLLGHHLQHCSRRGSWDQQVIQVDQKLEKLVRKLQCIDRFEVVPPAMKNMAQLMRRVIDCDASAPAESIRLCRQVASRLAVIRESCVVCGCDVTAVADNAIPLVHHKIKALLEGDKESLMSPRFPVRSTAAQRYLLTRRSSRSLRTSINDFKLIQCITRGGYGSVWLARKKRTKDLYAIKVLSKEHLRAKGQVGNTMEERNIMSMLQSDHVVQMFFALESAKYLYIVMEYMPGGDLFNLLQQYGYLDEDVARFYIAETVLALADVHNAGIIHRDLKPDNLLIDRRGHIKLSDFGLSKKGLLRKHHRLDAQSQASASSGSPHAMSHMSTSLDVSMGINRSFVRPKNLLTMDPNSSFVPDDTSERHKTGGGSERVEITGTPHYLSPDVLLNLGESTAVDWWALGVVLFELVTNTCPFGGNTPVEVFQSILAHDYAFPDESDIALTSPCKDLITRLLDMNPQRRLGSRGVQEIMQHPWFESIDWDHIKEMAPPFVPELDDDEDLGYFEGRQQLYPVDDDAVEKILADAIESDMESNQMGADFMGWSGRNIGALARMHHDPHLSPQGTPEGASPAADRVNCANEGSGGSTPDTGVTSPQQAQQVPHEQQQGDGDDSLASATDCADCDGAYTKGKKVKKTKTKKKKKDARVDAVSAAHVRMMSSAPATSPDKRDALKFTNSGD